VGQISLFQSKAAARKTKCALLLLILTSNNIMIPKKIHYVWLGGNPLPKRLQKCVDSWKKIMPDYDIIKWDESSIDINKNPLLAQCYQAKQFSKISEYFRAYVLYTEGGIYMDTDVALLRRLDEFLVNDAFCLKLYGKPYIESYILGATKGHSWLHLSMNAFIQNESLLPVSWVGTATRCLQEYFDFNVAKEYKGMAGIAYARKQGSSKQESRAEQNRAEQSRAEQSRAERNRLLR
jgi:mannosyltransferase OCH1-like enzyme